VIKSGNHQEWQIEGRDANGTNYHDFNLRKFALNVFEGRERGRGRMGNFDRRYAPGGESAAGSVLICNSSERGCARSVSRSALKMLRLVSDTAALRSNQDTAPPPYCLSKSRKWGK